MDDQTVEAWTPGTWEADADGIVRTPSGPLKLASAWIEDAWCGGDGNAETRANAHLIAAAPDLYAALSAILDGVEDESQPGDDMDSPVLLPLTLREIAQARVALSAATVSHTKGEG